MPVSEQRMKDVLTAYVEGFAAGDAEALIGLFAPDAIWEDPVGTEPRKGIEAIAEVYRHAAADTFLTLDTEIRASHGNEAAMAFTVDTRHEGRRLRIKVIDVMTFDEEGRIARMRAYWGPSDVTVLDAD
ncbi:nuclear transport factor 2 family protein [Streptomyces sp. BI20]|uniref:nuclear transport factor 2 family protein n=1 Tax=Streptomyces sp. BI20 TaxID=3403460 RepID=UPI003C7442AB